MSSNEEKDLPKPASNKAENTSSDVGQGAVNIVGVGGNSRVAVRALDLHRALVMLPVDRVRGGMRRDNDRNLLKKIKDTPRKRRTETYGDLGNSDLIARSHGRLGVGHRWLLVNSLTLGLLVIGGGGLGLEER